MSTSGLNTTINLKLDSTQFSYNSTNGLQLIAAPGGGIPGFTHYNDGYYNDNYFYVYSRDLTFIGNWKHLQKTGNYSWKYDTTYTQTSSFESFISGFYVNNMRMSTLDYTNETGTSPYSYYSNSLNSTAKIIGSTIRGESM